MLTRRAVDVRADDVAAGVDAVHRGLRGDTTGTERRRAGRAGDVDGNVVEERLAVGGASGQDRYRDDPETARAHNASSDMPGVRAA